MSTAETLLLVPLALSLGLYVMVVTVFLATYRRRRPDAELPHSPPFVTILKPLAGIDDDLASNLESFAHINYPSYEVLLGIASPSDPAWPVARAFASAHPDLPLRVIATDPDLAMNPKVAQLSSLTAQASGSVLVISDSNVRVNRSYLRNLLEELRRPGTGLVSSTVVGVGEKTLGAGIENAHLIGFILPVIAARWKLCRRAITVGKSIIMRREDLERVGGWSTVADVLAEDEALGRRFAEHGYGVSVCFDSVENTNSVCTVARTLERHSRWAAIRRSLDPTVLALEPFLSPTWIAIAALILVPGTVTAAAWVTTGLVQQLGTLACLRMVRGQWPSWRILIAECVRPYVTLVCWILAWARRTVTWRGHRFELLRGSVLVALDEPTPEKAAPGVSSTV